MSHSFVKVIPQQLQAFPIEDMDLDATMSFNLLNRPQRMQRVAWIAPGSLVFGPSETLHQIPIKAPGTAVYIPEWAAPCEAFQKITDHRFATSKLADSQWWHMVYHRYHTVEGQPVRVNAGKHFDASDWFLKEPTDKVVTTSYMACSSSPVRSYDGVRGFDVPRYLEGEDDRNQLFLEARGLRDPVLHELAAIRNSFFDPLVYPADGRQWPAGTITCFNALNIHEVQIAMRSAERGLLHISMYDGESKVQQPKYLRQSNPALAKVYFG